MVEGQYFRLINANLLEIRRERNYRFTQFLILRFGRKGVAINFVTDDDKRALQVSASVEILDISNPFLLPGYREILQHPD